MPAKKRQSSLSKTKSTTTYAHGGPMQHFREMHEARKAELSKRVLPKAQESVNTNTSHSMCVKSHCPGSGDPTKGTSSERDNNPNRQGGIFGFKSGPQAGSIYGLRQFCNTASNFNHPQCIRRREKKAARRDALSNIFSPKNKNDSWGMGKTW